MNSMTEKEKAIEAYRKSCLEIMAQNAPIVPDGVKVTVADADKYTALKNRIQDKMRDIIAPLSEKEKDDVILSIEDDLDMFIRQRGMGK
jgi:hypothetical protein